MLLLIFDIYHFLAFGAFTNVTAAVGLVKVDSVEGEKFMAVGALLRLGALLHFQLLFKIIESNH